MKGKFFDKRKSAPYNKTKQSPSSVQARNLIKEIKKLGSIELRHSPQLKDYASSCAELINADDFTELSLTLQKQLKKTHETLTALFYRKIIKRHRISFFKFLLKAVR